MLSSSTTRAFTTSRKLTMMTRVNIRRLLLIASFSCSAQALSANPTNPTGVARNIATQVLQGTGEAAVDLNQYNLGSIDEIVETWKAELVQKVGEQNIKPRLVSNKPEIFADTIRVSIDRQNSFGLELLELQGNREDGLGITIVQGIQEEGPCSDQDICIGDSLVGVTLVNEEGESTRQKLSQSSVSTECLDYDATVRVLQSLPPPSTQDQCILTFKRLRRKPKVTVKLQFPSDEPEMTLELFAGENLRQAMLIRNVPLNDELAKRFDTKNGGNCGAGGLCRTCAVSVLDGRNLLNPQRTAEQQMLRDEPRWRLACKAIVGYGMRQGTLKLRVHPRQW